MIIIGKLLTCWQQRLRDEVQRQAKAAVEVETKLQASQAEKPRLKDEVQRQTKVAADAEAKFKSAEAGFPVSSTGLFTIRNNMLV